MRLRAWGTLLLFLFSFTVGFAADEHAKQIDALFTPLVTSKSPGFAVIVVRHGHTLFHKGYGLADLTRHTKIDGQTDFRLASVTKQFTATAILLLRHDGKLQLDDRLAKFFPEFPAYGRDITIRQLLTHTSGLKDYGGMYVAKNRGVPMEQVPQLHDADVLKLLEEQSDGDFAPGTKWAYSNSGYAVLAMIVEKASGEPFEDFLRRRVFVPLHMKNTLLFVKGKNTVPDRAFGYNKTKDDEWVLADQSPTSAVLGDGGIYSSVDDLKRWDDALREHTLLSAAEMQPALTPVEVPGGARLPDGTVVQYGFGWMLESYLGRRRMYHDGGTIGFRTTIQRFTDEDLTIVVLSNRMDADPDALALKVADLYAPVPRALH